MASAYESVRRAAGACRPRLVCVLVALASVAGLASASAASAAADPVLLSRQIAAPWPAMQRSNGSFPDYLQRRGRPFRSLYGDAMLGYGLIQNGLRDGDSRAIDSGLKGVTRAVRDPGPSDAKKNAFEDLAVAAAYNLARERLAADPRFASVRGAWEGYIRRSRFQDLTSGRAYYNYFLVESVVALEVLRTGLGNGASGSILADPARSRSRALNLINNKLPSVASKYTRSNGALGPLTIMPDPPRNPPAYHALQVALLAHAIQLLGTDASPAARALLSRAAEASAALAGPDGDVSYFGRSQEQAWTLALTAYGVEVAALVEGPGVRRDRFLALSDAALDRLASGYAIGRSRYGISPNPALRSGRKSALNGLDTYVGAVDYTGLPLVGLNWLIERRGLRAATPVASEAGTLTSAILQRTPVTFATIRQGDLWYAIKERQTGKSDVRYDFGVIAFKARRNGTWRDVLSLRPKTPSDGEFDSAGPVLVRGDRIGFPFGRKLTIGADGVTTMTVDFRESGGRALRSGVPFRVSTAGSCLVQAFSGSGGDRYEFAAWFRGSPKVGASSASDSRQRVSVSGGKIARVKGGFASGLDASLKQATFARSGGGAVSISICAT